MFVSKMRHRRFDVTASILLIGFTLIAAASTNADSSADKVDESPASTTPSPTTAQPDDGLSLLGSTVPPEADGKGRSGLPDGGQERAELPEIEIEPHNKMGVVKEDQNKTSDGSGEIVQSGDTASTNNQTGLESTNKTDGESRGSMKASGGLDLGGLISLGQQAMPLLQSMMGMMGGGGGGGELDVQAGGGGGGGGGGKKGKKGKAAPPADDDGGDDDSGGGDDDGDERASLSDITLLGGSEGDSRSADAETADSEAHSRTADVQLEDAEAHSRSADVITDDSEAHSRAADAVADETEAHSGAEDVSDDETSEKPQIVDSPAPTEATPDPKSSSDEQPNKFQFEFHLNNDSGRPKSQETEDSDDKKKKKKKKKKKHHDSDDEDSDSDDSDDDWWFG